MSERNESKGTGKQPGSSSSGKGSPEREKRNQALERAMAQIERQYGKGAVMRLGADQRQEIEAISTGSISLDIEVVIKKGEHGAVMATEGETFVIPAYPTTDVKDPTGAGDTFAGGMMGWLAREGQVTARSLRRAIAYGTVMASFNVEDFGVRRTASLTLDDVDTRLREFRRMLDF